jgi:hypothetical protein
MAGRNFDLSIIINALDKTGSTFKNLNSDLKLTDTQLNTIALTSAATFATMVYGLKKAVYAAAEQQAAEINLANAMINTGNYTDKNFASNVKLADSLQWVSQYSDEEILSAEAMISRFSKDNEITKELTKATLNLAQAKGMDLVSAATVVAKSIGSSTNALVKYGVEVEGAAGSTDRATMAIQGINAVFGGAARAATLDYSGQINLLEKQIGELQESIGSWLLPKLIELSGKIYSNITSFRNWIETHKELATAIGGISLSFVGIIALVSTLAIVIPKLTTAFTILGNVIKGHPLMTIAAILIPLILNWDRLRNSIDENAAGMKTVGKIMDALKASFIGLVDILKGISLGFISVFQALTGHSSESIKSFDKMIEIFKNIPKDFKNAYDNINSTSNSSNKYRKGEEKTTTDLIRQMQLEMANNFTETTKIMTDDEKKMQAARVDAAYKAGDLTIAQYREELQERVNLLSKNHSDSLANEQEYLAAKQSLYEIDKQANIDMVAAKYANEVEMAETQKAYDLDSYDQALIDQLMFLTSQTDNLRAHQNDNLSALQSYYSNINAQRAIDKQLELNAQMTISGGFKQMLNDMNTYHTNYFELFKNIQGQIQNTFTTSFTNAFMTIGEGWESFAANFKNIGRDLLQIFVNNIISEMVKNWITGHTLMSAATIAWEGICIAASWAVAAAHQAAMIVAVVATKAWALASWLASQAVAAAKIIAGWSSIPFYGFALGVAAAAAAIAAMNSQFKMFATGTRGFGGGMAIVGENGAELVNLPNGSDVLNNAETRNILNSGSGSSGSGNAININIDFGGSTFMGTVDEITEALSNKIYKNLKLNAVI